MSTTTKTPTYTPPIEYRSSHVNARGLAAFITQLLQHGVKLPAWAKTYAETALLDHTPPVEPLGDLPGATAQQLIDTITRQAQQSVVRQAATDHASLTVRDEHKRQHLDALRAEADNILDQLRPTFDEHAEVMAQAVARGITYRTSAEQAISQGDDVVKIWREARAAAAALDQIALIRVQMTDLLGIEPYPSQHTRRLWPGPHDYSLAFSTKQGWHNQPGRWYGIGRPALRPIAEVAEDWRTAQLQAIHRNEPDDTDD